MGWRSRRRPKCLLRGCARSLRAHASGAAERPEASLARQEAPDDRSDEDGEQHDVCAVEVLWLRVKRLVYQSLIHAADYITSRMERGQTLRSDMFLHVFYGDRP